MKSVYVFSGLGADERVFNHIDFSGFNVTFVRWEKPEKDETLAEYAARLAENIVTEKPILIGFSFGGMVASEIAQKRDTEKVLILASVKTRQEIPFYYRIGGRLRIHKLLPEGLFSKPNALTRWFFGIETEEDKILFTHILKDSDRGFLKWAIDKILLWKNTTAPPNLIHIHGTADRVFPVRFVSCDVKVEGAGHFMTVNRAERLSQEIRKLL